MIIFLVSGKAGSGKDEFCASAKAYIESLPETHHGTVRFAFADAVKDIAHAIGWDGVKDKKGRGLLQGIGDGARKYDPHVWVKKMLSRIEKYYGNHLGYRKKDWEDILFLSDCRYPNEIDMPKEWASTKNGVKAVSIRIIRPVEFDNGLTPEQKLNTSETALDKYINYDYIILNNRSLKEFQQECVELTKQILKEE